MAVATLKNNQIDNRSKSNDNKIDDDNGKNSGKNKYKQRKKHQMCIIGSKQWFVATLANEFHQF